MATFHERRNILLGVTGSVAAYKSAELARILVKHGFNVQVVMTSNATDFITPLTLESVTGSPVMTNFEVGDQVMGIGHIQVADWADGFVIAPATANIIAKLAHGLADCPVSSVALATSSPVLVCPAMNVNMWNHPATQENIERLISRGIGIVNPEVGELACGWTGTGRLASPWEIFHNIRRLVSDGDFLGKNILITTGPTREALDPVRFLSNRSSGKMGVALAREAFRRGANVKLIHGPVEVKVPLGVETFSVVTAEEMKNAVFEHSINVVQPPDVVIMAAAVSDFKPSQMVTQKIKRDKMPRKIELSENSDILAELGKARKGNLPMLVGFAVETGEIEDLIAYGRDKLEKKNADIIVGNFATDAFDLDTNRVWIIDRNGRQEEVSTSYKSRVANKVLDAIIKH